jgi:DNA-binding MarR family transcriptional regulator
VRITREDEIGSLPATQARDLARWIHLGLVAVDDVASRLGLDLPTTNRVLDALEADGYLESRRFDDGSRCVTCTTRGTALAQASLGKPIRRSTADRLLAQTLTRVENFNADPQKFAVVDTVRVFGSYLDPAVDRLGDLDLAFEVSSRHPCEDPASARLRYADESGRAFSSFLDRALWWQVEPVMVARARSAYINITTQHPGEFTDRHEVVYRHPSAH